MSTAPQQANRWMDWTPKTRILGDSMGAAPTKRSKPGSVGSVGPVSGESPKIQVGQRDGSVGFEGAIHAESPKIEAGPSLVELARASGVLNRVGVRIMELDGVTTMGVWSDLDGPEVRAALRTMGGGEVPVRYLDGDGIPARYKVRRVTGHAR
jgi:hypothetical protein